MIVYRYGCPSWVDLDEVGMEQIRLAHELRNELVEIEHRYQDAVKATWDLFPLIADTKAAVEAAQAVVDALQQRASQERRSDRTTAPRAGTREELVLSRRRLRDARAACREAKALLYPQAKACLLDVRRARDTVCETLYTKFCQGRGLHWATYNDVTQTHETAVRRVADARRRGRPAELRFRRWDGSGTLTVQLQRGAGKPARTFELLSSGSGPWRNVVRFWPEERLRGRHQQNRRKSKHWEIAVNVGRGRHVQLPIVLDRWPHEEADVTLVRITRRRVAGHYRLSVSLTARIPAPEPPADATVCVHTGWRAMEGDMRVAIVTADRPMAAPPAGLPVRKVQPGWEVRLPSVLRHAHERTDKLRSRRNTDLDAMRAALGEWLEEHPQPDLTASQVLQWRAPRRFAQLAITWRDDAPESGSEIAEMLEAWRRRDRRLWEREANERDQVAARIRDMWAKIAAWLTIQAGLVRVDATDIQATTRVPEAGNNDPIQARLARTQRQIASPGQLRAAIRQAARARGVSIEAISLVGTTSKHHACGATLIGEPARHVTLWCPDCGRAVDQDINAALHLLAAPTTPASHPGPETDCTSKQLTASTS